MKRALVALITGTVLSGLAAAYATTSRQMALESPAAAPVTVAAPAGTIAAR